MTSLHLSRKHCFLCRRKYHEGLVKTSIEKRCPASRKKIKNVLQHLSRLTKTELQFTNDWLCTKCCYRVIQYDTALFNVLQKQHNLSILVEKAASICDFDTDVETECDEHMPKILELANDECFTDVDVSESEINEAVNETIRYNKLLCQSKDTQLCITSNQKFQQANVECNFCAMQFKNKTRLNKHISLAHKKFACELCNFSHRNEDYVKLHMNIHEGRKETQCRFCNKEFTTKISTIRHMEVHIDSKKYQCDKCGLCFSQTTILYNHKLQHEAEERPLRCETCKQIFKTKRTYRHHMVTHRIDRPRYNCEYCSKTFTEKYTLKVHRRTHHETMQMPGSKHPNVSTTSRNAPMSESESKIICIICKQQFNNKEHLNKHMEREHDVILKSLSLTNYSRYEEVTKETKRPCHICGHMFRSQNNLDHHIRNMHLILLK